MKRILVSAAALLALCACATAPPEAPANPAAPALYVVRDDDSTMYLYGTIHLRRAGDAWGGPHVEAALAESEEVWTELLITPEAEAQGQAAALRLGLAPPDQPLSAQLEPEDQARLAALSERLGLPAAAIERMRPWLAAVTLSVAPMVQAGFDPALGVDRAITAWAAANGRPMRGFETAEAQVGFFASLSEETQRQMLLYAIDNAEGGVETVQSLSVAWDRGDLQLMEQVIIADVRDRYPEPYEALFVRRNNAWMEVLRQEMAGSGVDFVAVGAGHLLGEDGLVAQLRASGFEVRRVEEASNTGETAEAAE